MNPELLRAVAAERTAEMRRQAEDARRVRAARRANRRRKQSARGRRVTSATDAKVCHAEA